jgi:hypothetical protein
MSSGAMIRIKIGPGIQKLMEGRHHRRTSSMVTSLFQGRKVAELKEAYEVTFLSLLPLIVATQQLNKHVPAAAYIHVTMQ